MSETTRETPDAQAKRTMWPSEAAVSEVVGRLIEFWGFKRNMGRVWALLYLSADPLSAEDLRRLLSLSSGSVSMTLGELSRWGVVRRVWVQGERRDFFAAEVNLWRMISRVWNEREKSEIQAAIETLQAALGSLDRLEEQASRKAGSEQREMMARIRLQRERITRLLDLARLGGRMFEVLLSTAKLDAEPLVRFLLGQRSA